MHQQWALATPAYDDPAETFHVASKLSLWTSGSATGTYSTELSTDPEALRMLGRPHPPYLSSERRALDAAGPASPVAAALRHRHSAAGFAPAPVSFGILSGILRETACITAEHGRGAPSAGGLCPIDIYLAVTAVDGITPGIYALDPHEAVLHRLPVPVDPREFLRDCLVFQNLAEDSAFHVFFVGSFLRQRIKYGQRAYRFTLLEAGHLAQAMMLCAEEAGIGSCAVGGFLDQKVDELLCLDGVEQSVIYSVAFGQVIEESGGLA
ncbi:SagB-type dehydrogenase family enzyme [Arthrobacter woluwensis]|uniref:SagB family peptide dehydrogenase n=1 Tax=Arthrobacter woluwensis TaxID=156980 RepID=UPI00278A977D|nr:SagB family peptide dehydrogenase [Arthrobacter woluwensis]MDQ0708360.1 SagB-type dehydrogenase family enzyme [Arthrobacter woluwensis]